MAVDAGTVFSAAGVLHVLIVVVVGVHVLLNKQNEGAAFSWLGIVTLSPFLGAALYWVFGINRIRRHAQAERPRRHGARVSRDDAVTLPGLPLESLPDVPPKEDEHAAGPERPHGAVTAETGDPSPTAKRVRSDAPRVRPEAADGSRLPGGRRRTDRAPPGPAWMESLPPRWQGLARLGLAIHPAPYLEGNEVVPLIDGDEAYPRMLEAIAEARESVVLSSYIFEYDEAGRRFVDALIRARSRGVAVRVLIDGLGVGYGFSLVRADRVLRRAGVPTARFLPFLSRAGTRFLNLRNHRKILSVDGRVAFVGGMNIRAGNLLALPSAHHTQDTHFLVRGPVIEQIDAVFADDWHFASGERLALPGWRGASDGERGDAAPVRTPAGKTGATSTETPSGEPVPLALEAASVAPAAGRTLSTPPAEPAGEPSAHEHAQGDETRDGESHSPRRPVGTVVARVLLDGPDDNYQKLQHTMIGAINVARRSIDVVTPYFLPGRTVISALQIASLRGVRVRICVPAKNNLPFVDWAMRANVRKLVGYGIEIVASPPPFDHSKLFVVDDRWTLIGSSNWDARSLELNFEVNVECYDPAFNARVRRIIAGKLRDARALGGGPGDPLLVRLRNNFFRLFSPYL